MVRSSADGSGENLGRSALVTGGSLGIGLEFAKELSKKGYEVKIVGRNVERLENAKHEIQEACDTETSVVTQSVDLGSSGIEMGEIFDRSFSLVILNAGIAGRGKILEQSPEVLERMVKTNISQQVLMTKHAILNAQSSSTSCTVLHVSSIVSDVNFPFSATYGATKRFNELFAIQVARSLRGKDIRTHVVKPSTTTTRLTGYKDNLFTSEASQVASATLNSMPYHLCQTQYGSLNHAI